MIGLLGAALLVAGFLLLFWLLKIAEQSASVLALARVSAGDLARKDLPEEEKETLIQGHAVKMMGKAAAITLSLAVAVAAPYGLLKLLDLAGLMSEAAAMRAAMSWPFLLAATAASLGLFALSGRRRR